MTMIRELTVDLLDDAVGIDNTAPKFGWKLRSEERNFIQEAYQIRVCDRFTNTVLWDSGKVNSEENSFISYKGKQLQSRQCCEWNVRVWDRSGQDTGWSESAFFEMGLLHREDWKAMWIEPVQREVQKEPVFDMQRQLEEHGEEAVHERLNPCQFCRREIIVEKSIRKARIYATAHGVYELQLNGKKAGNLELAPGFTSYSKCLQYQTYDITELLHLGTRWG